MRSLVSLAATTLLVTPAVSGADISVTSSLGRKLLDRAQPAAAASSSQPAFMTENRRLEDEDNNAFLIDYSIKFQGCHHVQQWNEDVDEENDVRIMTKRLARFRLCPADSCSNEKSAGCSSSFGDYIVDMDTFVQAYLEAMEEEYENLCNQVEEDCDDMCGDGDEDNDCMYECYDGYEATACFNENNNNDMEDFDVKEYAECKQYDMPDNNNRNLRKLEQDEEEEIKYYVGAYCADQGGEVRLGLFSDDTCTTYVENGAGYFYSATGYTLPYSQDSLVSTRCLSCLDNDGDNNNDNNNNNNNGNYEAKEVCENVYAMSGKCETRMNIDYPNESSCNYIEGVKIIRQDGVIRTSQTRKSKAAAVAIGLFTTLSVLLAGYVYYLRTKLSRAQINLTAASQPLS